MAEDAPVRVLLVCSHGGHLTEMLQVLPAFEGMSVQMLTHASTFTEGLGEELGFPVRTVEDHPAQRLWLHLPAYFWRVARAFLRMAREHRPHVVVSTGAEIAIPVFYLARAKGIRLVFLDSLCRVDALSGTARAVKPVADEVFVQWPEVAEASPGLTYGGAVL